MRCLAICFVVEFIFNVSPSRPCGIRAANNLQLGFSVHNAFVQELSFLGSGIEDEAESQSK